MPQIAIKDCLCDKAFIHMAQSEEQLGIAKKVKTGSYQWCEAMSKALEQMQAAMLEVLKSQMEANRG